MPRIVITHAVTDIERWLEGKAERAAAIESGSGSNVTDFVARTEATTSPSPPTWQMSTPCRRCWPHRRRR
jgi:hypothetical protein